MVELIPINDQYYWVEQTFEFQTQAPTRTRMIAKRANAQWWACGAEFPLDFFGGEIRILSGPIPEP